MMKEVRFRQDRQSGSSVLECGRLKLWVIGLLRNLILFVGWEPRGLAMKGFRPAFIPQGGTTRRSKASSPDRLSRVAMEAVSR